MLGVLIIKAVYHLSLRTVGEFMLSMIALLALGQPVPCYARTCRRAKELG
ncbi:transposase [Neochlamydia sp. TUME1]|nr:transposase [Neochlamydia sp. TUME1]